MRCVRKVTGDLYWVGANDRHTPLFENIHPIPRGVSYNSYLLLDEKTVLFDCVDWSAAPQLVENVESLLQGRGLDYIVLHHLEPDHGAGLWAILQRWPNAAVVSSVSVSSTRKECWPLSPSMPSMYSFSLANAESDNVPPLTRIMSGVCRPCLK